MFNSFQEDDISTNSNSAKSKYSSLKKILVAVLALVSIISLTTVGIFVFYSKPVPVQVQQVSVPLTKSNDEEEDLSFTEEEHRALSRKFAAEGMVLAVNNGLPLEKADQVVLFGYGTSHTIYGGTGSGEVYQKGVRQNIVPVQIVEGIEAKAEEEKFIYVPNEIGWEIGGEESELTEDDIKQFAEKQEGANRTVAVLTISRVSGEGGDRPQDQSKWGTKLKDSEKNTYQALKNYFDTIVVILNVGSVIELEGWEKDENTSILISYLPGMEAGNAIADVLVGDSYPSGHTVDTWAKTIADYPTTNTFTENILYVKYKEGLFVGYRYFEDDQDKQSKVVFPFGWGLSYTTFKMHKKCHFDADAGIIHIEVIVTNTGRRAGKEAIQVYVEKPQNEAFIKVKRELIAFAKTPEMPSRSIYSVKIKINVEDFASYDDTGVTGEKNVGSYVLEAGEYKIYVGTNVAETRNEESLIYTYKNDQTRVTKKLHTRLQPKDKEVADANTKPDFSSFMYDNYHPVPEEPINLPKIENNEENNKEQENEETTKHDYSNLPTNEYSEINFKTVLEGKNKMEDLVNIMSDDELAFLAYGHSANIRSGTGTIGGLYNAGRTGKYLIPSADTLDGPAGLRQSEVSMQSTAWPCSTALASTFDVDVMRVVGEETGKECRKINCTFWLAPGMNIHRSPLCGRNFEYYSEDPVLTGKMAASISRGFQSKRCSITLKHFAFNDKEQNRGGEGDSLNHMASDSRMAERVAREIYLKGFEIAVKEGKPLAIMTSYNRMNGIKTAENHELVNNILREEWGFDGLVMTDWGSNSKNDREAHARGDVKMPGGSHGDIISGITKGTVTRSELKRNAVDILNVLARTAAIDPIMKKQKAIEIGSELVHIKLADNIFHKDPSISYEECQDKDGGYNPSNTRTNTWVTILINNPTDCYKNFKIRYNSLSHGFGVIFKKYDETLGEIINLDITGTFLGRRIWETSIESTVHLPQGEYELMIMFAGYDFRVIGNENYKGVVNWIEIS